MHIFYISMPLLYLLHIIVVKRNEKKITFGLNDSFYDVGKVICIRV